jgi:PadR family transcriptional regulator AphA
MSLNHILLGMLREPSTGYELGKEFSEGAQHFWFAELSQIYPTLKRMRDRGWLDTWEEPSERGPKRKVYKTTAEGRAELRTWLRDGPRLGRERLGFIAQTFFLGELESYEESLSIVRKMRAMWEHKLGYLEHVERMVEEDHGDPSHYGGDGLHNHAALRMGIHMLRAKLAWCAETLERLETRLELAEPTPAG